MQTSKSSLMLKLSWIFVHRKKDPHRIQITAGRNLIQYKGKVSMRTADLTMSKLLWNSVLSTCNANNMCLDINFLSKYMRMPLEVFLDWIKKHYNLDKYAHNGHVYVHLERTVWGLLQARILANKPFFERDSPPTDTMSA